MTLAVATYNLGDGSENAVLRDLDRLAGHAQVLCLQEAGDRHDTIHDFLMATPGWVAYYGTNTPGGGSVPILYQSILTPTVRSRLAVPPIPVGPGAGPSIAKAKAILELQVGSQVVMNTHMIASASGPNGRALRKVHYRRHMRVLAGMVQRRVKRGLHVLAVGDFNSPPDDPLLDPLRAVLFPPVPAMTQLVPLPTHGRRILDHGWSDQMGSAVVGSGSSDHHPVVITLPG